MASPSAAQFDGSSWSKLPLDLLNMVFERLGIADFQRAKSVCPSWLYASRQSTPNNQIPWLILFPEKGNDYCLLFNPEEEEKVYRIKDLGDNFANSHCLAICGSWLFMRDPRYNLYIMNLFTRERIDLPSVVSQIGGITIERTGDDYFCIKVDNEYSRGTQKHIDMSSPFLWIDEKTRDYVVIWSMCYDYEYLVYSKKGDNCWKHTSCSSRSVFDMVCKDQKVYLYGSSRDVKVLDFSGDIPRQIFETQVNYCLWRYKGMPRRVYPERGDVWPLKKTHLVVTLSGEALRVKSIIMTDSDVWSFRVYKMDSSNSKWEKITYLGDQAILLDQGITVLANANEGIERNSIYFNGYRSFHYTKYDHVWNEKDIFIFNFETHEVKRPRQSIYSSIQSSDARWFVPNFNRR